ncbi:MAG: hypothetical protein AB7P14_10290 [Blastocatellales bacterium]
MMNSPQGRQLLVGHDNLRTVGRRPVVAGMVFHSAGASRLPSPLQVIAEKWTVVLRTMIPPTV